MIPSRALTVGEILVETFKIYRRTFWRTILLQLIFVVPCVVIVILGLTNVSNSIGDVVSSQHSISDAEITSARNSVLLAMEQRDPGSIERMRRVFHESTSSWDAPLTKDTISSGNAMNPASTDTFTRSPGISSRSDQQAKETILGLLSSPSFINGWIWLFLGILLFFLAANAPVAGGTDLASRSFEERPIQLSLVWGPLLKRNLWMVLAYQLGIGVIAWGATMIRLPFMFAQSGTGIFMMLIVSMATTIAMVYLMLRFIATIPAIISEELNLIEGFKRSWTLTRGHFWRILGLTLSFGLIACAIGFIILVILLIIIAPQFIELMRYVLFAQHVSIVPITRAISKLIWTGGLAYLIPILLFSSMSAIFSTVLYYDLRTRHDGPLEYDVDTTPLTPIFGSIQPAQP